MSNRSFDTTRRGFLRGSIGATLIGTGCSHEMVTEAGHGPEAPRAAADERVRVATTVNGQSHSLDVHPDDAALDMVRNELHLTGCKLGCGHGACGACTMNVDGVAVATCILPATALHERKVVTVEGLAAKKTLHPVQRAFMAQDALQCGYCTPGFVVEAAAFCDRWREQNGHVAPNRETIVSALAGHLCRCGAYDAIFEAVAGACAGKYDDGEVEAPRYDARAKVTGDAKYTVDIQLDGMLHAKVLHSPHANARVTKLDWSRALKIPGVRAAVKVIGDTGTIRYVGQEILAIAAVDERTAEEALAAVDIEYAVSPPVLTMEAARAAGAPAVYARRRDRKHPPNASEGPLLPERWDGNVRGPLSLFSKHKGRARRAIENARTSGTVAEGTYTTQVQCHTPLEPHAAVAQWDGDRLTVWMSTQAVTHMARDIAERWDLPHDNVRVISEYIGGGFGAKATLTTEVIVAVELARVAKAPVRFAYDRRNEIMLPGNRPASQTEIAVAVDGSGDLAGMRAVTHSSSGVAVGHITGIMMRIIYPKAPRELVDYDVITHLPPGKPFRGPGGPMAFWALEQALDDVAHQRGEDPLQMRRRFDPNPARKPLYGWAEALPAWRNRSAHASDKGRYRRGIGVACGAWFTFTEPKTRLQLDTGPGGIVASMATQDIGNGTRTSIAETVSGELGMRPHEIDVRVGDSRFVHGPQAGGSRTTSSVIPACLDACAQLREELFEAAVAHFGLRDAEPSRSGILHREGVVRWRDVLAIAPPITVVGRRRRDQGGYVFPPVYDLAVEKYISSSIQISEVEVDTRLGRVRVLETWGGYGIGRIVSPTLATSQAKGGLIQGIGYALYEERRIDPNAGYLLSAGLEDYRIPGIGDIGRLHVHFDEGGYHRVRGRAVGLGELVTLAPAASIGNAIFHATGWRPRDLPIRPDRVLQGVRA